MITSADVIHFYEKYKENLRLEERAAEELTHCADGAQWVEKLKQKYRTMRGLYIENEALLNLYVRPFLEGRTELTAAAASAFVDQIRQAWREGFEDQVSMLEMGEILEPFTLEHGLLEDYIWDIALMGILYNNCMEKADGEKGYACFKKICALSDRYFEIQDFEVRKRIIYAFYNRPILQVNFLLEDEETLLRNLEGGMAFFRDPRVLALDGERFDFEGLAQELNYDVYGNYVISHTRENAAKWFLERGEKVLEGYYARELEKNPNPYAMPDEIFCYYKRTLFFLGKLSCTEFLTEYRAYCDYSLAHDTLEDPGGFHESRLFHVAVNHLPGILECLHLYGAEYEGPPIDKEQCVRDYLSIMRKVPRGGGRFANDAIQKSLHSLMELMEEDDAQFESLVEVMLNRDEITLIHAHMVSRIAQLLLRELLERRPELLVGALGTQNVVEVLESRDQLLSFTTHAAKLFDMGKLKDFDIVNKQSRQLTRQELDRIYAHPVIGGDMVRKSRSLSQFQDVVLGHHKSWDGLMGYPEYFDNTASRDRMLIEIIHISDCLDAATDFIGRSYKVPKSLEDCLEELRQGAGTLYCPELVELLLESKPLQESLSKLLNQGRIHTYCEVYGIDTGVFPELDAPGLAPMEAANWNIRFDNAVEADEKERLISVLHESSQANYNFVRAMVRHSLLTLYVDLRSGRYQVFSRGEQRLFGGIANGTYPDFLSKYLRTIALPGDWEKLKYQLSLAEVFHALVMQEGRFECEMRLRRSGQYRWARLQFMKLDDKNVIPRTMALVITDAQERHDRSEQMEAALKEAYETAMEASRTKSIFLSNMSHDIRTPMNGIMGMTKIALEHLDDRDRVEDCLKKIETSSAYLMSLLNEVLDMSRIESGKTVLHEEPVLLEKLMEEVLDVCRPDIGVNRQELLTQLNALRGAWVLADPMRLRQIFTNILSNAVKYTPAGGRIQVAAQCLSVEKGGCWQFRFEDNGIGMSPAFLKQLFEPFAREDNSMTSARQGTGLGLSITRAMVTRMGGTIEVSSTQGKGTVFTVTLPLRKANRVEEQPEQESNARFDGCRILLAEDNELNREIACELLSAIGLEIETANDGLEAVEQFRARGPGYYDLILTDIQMPRMNGMEAAKAIRALPEGRNIPIVALTANVFQEDVAKILENGINAHLAKPIDIKEVKKTLGRWLQEEDIASSNPLVSS